MSRIVSCVIAFAPCLLAVACVPPPTAPQQVQASNPATTYRYHNDQELLAVNQSATAFCGQYQSVPRAASFTGSADGARVVSFECVPSATLTVVPVASTNMVYPYRTDPELLESSRSASAYCVNRGYIRAVPTFVTQPGGVNTVTYQCSRA